MQSGWRVAVGVGVVVFAVSVAAPQKIHSDSLWVVPTALSLLLRGDLDLDEYRPTCEEARYGCSELNGHVVSDFPPGPALVTAAALVPFEALLFVTRALTARIAVLDKAARRWESHRDAVGAIDLQFFDVTEHLVASLCVAVAAGFFVSALRRRVGEAARAPWRSLLLTAVLAFGTAAFSTASRVMWQHGPALMCSAAALWLCTLPPGRGQAFALGAVLGFGWVCRPTMALFAALVLVFVALRRRAVAVFVVEGAVAVVVLFVAANEVLVGQALPPYYLASRLEPFTATFVEALAGNLISPSRGVLIFTPVLALVPWAVRRSARAGGDAAWLDGVLALWLVGHWLVISAFPHWWGGHSYGPRFWTETAAAAVWLLAPLLEEARSRRWLIALAAVGVVAHGNGALRPATWGWNDHPVNVDEAPARVWSWADPQFLR